MRRQTSPEADPPPRMLPMPTGKATDAATGTWDTMHFAMLVIPLLRLLRPGENHVRLILLAALAGFAGVAPLHAQTRTLIRGRVIDAGTGAPLEFVNVFLAGTTRGTGTSVNGTYSLSNLPSGYYRLVASRVGYEVASFPVQVGEADTLGQDFALVARIVRAAEVEIVAGDPSRWRRDMVQFQGQFLGTGRFADSCVILNPEVIGFDSDSASGTLEAKADSVVRVRNDALGYRLDVHLQEFIMRRESNAVSTTLYVRFEQMQPRNRADSLRWSLNRKEAYEGSRLHFLRSLVRGRVESEGFFIFDAEGRPIGPDGHGLVFDVESGGKRLAHEGILRIEYRGSDRVRKNFVRFAMGILSVYPDGNLVENQEFIIDPVSDWANERLARMVPLDYREP